MIGHGGSNAASGLLLGSLYTAVTRNMLPLADSLTPTCGLFSLPLYAWLLVVFAATSLRENTVLLNFTVEAL